MVQPLTFFEVIRLRDTHAVSLVAPGQQADEKDDVCTEKVGCRKNDVREKWVGKVYKKAGCATVREKE